MSAITSFNALYQTELFTPAKDLQGLFTQIEEGSISRVCLDTIAITDSNEEMVKSAKLIASLREVRVSELTKMQPYMQGLYCKPNKVRKHLGKTLQFKHLLMVPYRHYKDKACPSYERVFADSNQLNEESLQKIYEMAWSRINRYFSDGQLNLIILDIIKPSSFPNYAFRGIIQGLVQPCAQIRELALPFSIDEEQLKELGKALEGKSVDRLYLSFSMPIAEETLELFAQSVANCNLRTITLKGLPGSLKERVMQWAQANGISLQLD
jgi:hypothetical protein